MIRIGLTADFHDSHNGGRGAAVIEKSLIAELHGFHEIARLIVAHTIP